ncbi:MAG: elongation factor Ts [Bradymonadia bacterium]|jgi:elongation factor Ts
MAITASAVKELRERTGAGMMDCKKALVENDGDLEVAADYLRAKGIAKAAKKADRVAAEGLVGASVSADAKQGGLVEVNSETDFVARNDEFKSFVDDLAAHTVVAKAATAEALLASELGGTAVEELRKAKIASIGENINVRRAVYVSLDAPGVVANYIHGGGTIGVLTTVLSESDVDATGPVADLARDVALHIAASNPLYVSADEIEPAVLERERAVLVAQAIESGKPADIAEKMVVGRMKKFSKEICLLDQPFVKNPDVTIQGEIDRVSSEVGQKLTFGVFHRFKCGEGIEKVESNLAEEVAAQLK